MSTESPPSQQHMPTGTAVRSWPAVWLLGLGTFVYVTTELLPVGLLPNIGAGLGVSTGIAGLIVSVYGGVAALTAAPLTALARRVNRKWLLAGLLTTLIVGNLISAITPSYAVLLVARLLIGFAHGVFWSTTPAAGARLVEPKNQVRAIAVVLGGISVASVLGVPLGTAIGHAANWRIAFLAVAGLGIVVLAAVMLIMPSLPAENTGSLAAMPGLLRRGSLQVAILVAALTMTGHYLAYTYLAPYLERIVGIPTGLVSVLLLVFGGAGIAGNFLASAAVARGLRRALIGAVALLAASLLALFLFGGHAPTVGVVLLITWGLSYAALPVCLQTWVLRCAPEATDAASSLYVAVFNGSIAVGALVGSLAVQTAGIGAVTWIGAAAAGLALAVVLISRSSKNAASSLPNNQSTNEEKPTMKG